MVIQRAEDVLLTHRHRLNIVEVTVVTLQHQRVNGGAAAANLRVTQTAAPHHGVEQRADREGVAQQNRRLQHPQLVQLHQPQRLGEAVEHRAATRQRLVKQIARRHDSGNAGLAFAVGQRVMPDADARHVAQGVGRAGRIARARQAAMAPPIAQQIVEALLFKRLAVCHGSLIRRQPIRKPEYRAMRRAVN